MSQYSTDLGDGDFATGIPYKAPQAPKRDPGPDTTSFCYDEMKTGWDMVDDIWGGTVTMQDAGRKWLPQEPAESDEAYGHRLFRSIFFNATKRTVQMLVGKPFSKPVHWPAEINPVVKDWLNDIDRCGRQADVFLKDALQGMIKDGHAIFMVDYDVADENMTLADKQERQMRPYVLLIDPRNMIAWRSQVINGYETLVHARIKECAVEQVGEWDEQVVEYIRVFDRGVFDADGTGAPTLSVMWRLYRKLPGDGKTTHDTWVLDKTGFLIKADGSYVEDIPLFAAYGSRKGYFESELPLEDLMHLNIDHWRSSSDQRHILHVTRFPIKFAKGFIPGTKGADGNVNVRVSIGPDALIATENPQGDMKYVEHNGASISAGRQNCEDIKIEMAVMGAEKLVKKTVFATATEEMHDNTAEDSELAAMCKSLQETFKDVLQVMCEFAGIAETGLDLQINTEFGIFPWQLQILANLINLYSIGAVSHLTLLKEFQRLGALSDVLSVEDEVKIAQDEFGKRQKAQAELSQQTVKSGPGAPGQMTKQIQNM